MGSAGKAVDAIKPLGMTDPITGRRVVLHCGDITRDGPDECSAANGTALYLFASKASRPLATSPM